MLINIIALFYSDDCENVIALASINNANIDNNNNEIGYNKINDKKSSFLFLQILSFMLRT